MNLDDIAKLVSQGESDILEFKKTTAQLRRAGETICGMLNSHGGMVIFGISPEGKILGQKISDTTLRNVAEMLSRFEPSARITPDRIKADSDKDILILKPIPDPERRPYTFDGRPYQRTGSTTSRMPQDAYQRLLTERAHSQTRWENHAADGYDCSNLNHEEILRTLRLGIAAGRLPESTGNDISDILNRLELMKNGIPVQSAIVLFGTKSLADYPQCQVRMARFRGTDKSTFIDQRQVTGNAFHLLDEAMLFLRRHLPVAGRIVPGLFEREDEPLFPLEALREGLVNAFCHRDYSIVGGSVSLAIYDDRLEIWSDGNLPFGLTPEDLRKEHPSRPRNPLIANVFYLRGLIERWGRGTQKIISLCVKAGHPEPEFGEQAGSVWIRFPASGYIAPHRVAHDLTDRQREILQILSKSTTLAFRDIRSAMHTPPPDRTLREDLIHLKRLNLLVSEGFGRGAAWQLTDVNKAGIRQE